MTSSFSSSIFCGSFRASLDLCVAVSAVEKRVTTPSPRPPDGDSAPVEWRPQAWNPYSPDVNETPESLSKSKEKPMWRAPDGSQR